MKLSISEILEQASQKTTREDKINFLRTHDNQALRQILAYCFDPSVKWVLPEGRPPFKYSQAVEGHGMLYSQCRKLYLFIEGGNPHLHRLKREQLFIGLLESLDPKDADLVIAIKDKIMPYDGITPELVNEALGMNFPVAPMVSPGVKTVEPPPVPAPDQPVKRGRGRPKGAKNKPKNQTQSEVRQ